MTNTHIVPSLCSRCYWSNSVDSNRRRSTAHIQKVRQLEPTHKDSGHVSTLRLTVGFILVTKG